MKYNRLGATGLYVSEICLGTMTFGGSSDAAGTTWAMLGGLQQQAVDDIIGGAVNAGVNFIDTADTYSGGECERLVGRSMRNLGILRKDIVLATKTGLTAGRGANDRGASRGHIMDSIRMSLDRLGTDHIDLYQIHTEDPVTPIDETLRALDDIVSQGLARYVGVSNWPAWKIARGLGIAEARGYVRTESTQAYYSIAGRDIEREFVPLIEAENLGLLIWSPLAGGYLSGKYRAGVAIGAAGRRSGFDFPPIDVERADACVAAMAVIADRNSVSVAQVALAWVLHRRFVTSVIVGVRTQDQLIDNLAATGVTLAAEDMAALDDVAPLVAEYPAWLTSRRAERIPPPHRP